MVENKSMHVKVAVLEFSVHPLDGSNSSVMQGNCAAPYEQTRKGKHC